MEHTHTSMHTHTQTRNGVQCERRQLRDKEHSRGARPRALPGCQEDTQRPAFQQLGQGAHRRGKFSKLLDAEDKGQLPKPQRECTLSKEPQ